jgi:hypothetical protein
MVPTGAGEHLPGAMLARCNIERVVHRSERPEQRRGVDAVAHEGEMRRPLTWTDSHDFATQVSFERREMRPVIARTFEVERDREGRAASTPHDLDRQRKQTRRVDASAREHGHALRPADGALDGALERVEEHGSGALLVRRRDLVGTWRAPSPRVVARLAHNAVIERPPGLQGRLEEEMRREDVDVQGVRAHDRAEAAPPHALPYITETQKRRRTAIVVLRSRRDHFPFIKPMPFD